MDALALQRRLIELEVAGVHDPSDGCAEHKGMPVRDAVDLRDERHLERSDAHPAFRVVLTELR